MAGLAGLGILGGGLGRKAGGLAGAVEEVVVVAPAAGAGVDDCGSRGAATGLGGVGLAGAVLSSFLASPTDGVDLSTGGCGLAGGD